LRLGPVSALHLSDRARYPRNGHVPKDCDKFSVRLAQRILEEMEEAGVDHLVVTGDLTLTAEAGEFERAAKLLRRFADAGKLTVVPGNHDVWTAESVKTARFLRIVGPDGKGMRKAVATYPFAAVPSPEVAVIAIDTAQFGEEPFETPGLVGSAQVQAARDLVREQVKEGRAVLLALHHHLLLPRERIPSDVRVARMPLLDADKVVRMVSDLPIAGVLHGHRHCAFRVDIPGAAGSTPILCAGSATRVADEPVRKARGHVYEVDRGGIRSVQAVFPARA
jgi:3',5'-cyclic AMP phosphodiesterase CpdA